MSHYEEEQRSEIEALESIYSDDFTLLQSEPFYRFKVYIKTVDYEVDTENGAACELVVDFVSNYPDEVPLLQLTEASNVEDDIVQLLAQKLTELAEENKGMVMVFTLVSSLQEWLENEIEELKRKQIEDKERRVREAEEAEKKKFEGTRVTVESFLKWKAAFEAEMLALKKRAMKDDSGVKKITGRQLFEKDHSLYDSDIRFLQEELGEEEVKIDESLFQDMDELELDDGVEIDEEN